MMSSRCEEKRSEVQKRQIGVLVLGGMVKNELISFLDGLEKNWSCKNISEQVFCLLQL